MGIGELLGNCPNLKLVILNGCSTKKQVDRLLQLKNAPVVIATSAPVNDYSATQFSASFFQSFSEQYASIRDAFQIGLAAAQIRSTDVIWLQKRGAGLKDLKENDPLWGLYCRPGHEIQLEWSIPVANLVEDSQRRQPNQILLDLLVEYFAPYQEKIKKLHEQEMEGREINVLDKRRAILETLPHPISEHLRKLLVEKEETSEQVFYDQFSLNRLHQLATTYRSVVELPAFILLAQLWDILMVKKDRVLIDERQRELLKKYLNVRTSERIRSMYFQLIVILKEILTQNGAPLFVQELETIGRDFESDSDLYNACLFFENIEKKKALSKEAVESYCIEGEEKLATILGKFGFFTKYTLISVKNIRVKKNRYDYKPKFQHRLVELIQRFVGLAPTQYETESIIDDSSIHLKKKINDQIDFLNLSPFIIDEHAFNDAAQIAKLYYFDSYQKGIDACCFRHIYKPKDNLLLLKSKMIPKRDKNWELGVFRRQFDVFAELLFNQPLKQL